MRRWLRRCSQVYVAARKGSPLQKVLSDAEQTAPATRTGRNGRNFSEKLRFFGEHLRLFRESSESHTTSEWTFKRFARIRFPAKFCPAFGPLLAQSAEKSATGTKNAQTIRSGEPIAYSILLFISCGSSIHTSC